MFEQHEEEVAQALARAERTVASALEAGATDAEVVVRTGVETEVSVRNGIIEQLSQGQPASLGVRVWRGARSATARVTDFREETVGGAIAQALEMAAFADEVPELALPERTGSAPSARALDLYEAGVPARSVDERIERARELESAAMASDSRLTVSAGAGFGDLAQVQALATSRGFSGAYAETWTSEHVEVLAEDQGGRKRNGSAYQVARHIGGLDAVEVVAALAAERAVGQLGASPMETGRYPIVFDPYSAAALLREVFSVLTGAALERGASFLQGALGEQIASALVTVIDDPLRAGALGSRPWDGEGAPSSVTRFVDAGVLESYALNTFHARKLGMKPTGHATRPSSGPPGEGPSNLYLAAGTSSEAELIAGVERGFYCDSMMGFGFNATTGDFSRGASGFLIEGGKLTRPVSEVTVSARMQDILRGVVGVGAELTFDRRVVSPALLVEGMTLAGGS